MTKKQASLSKYLIDFLIGYDVPELKKGFELYDDRNPEIYVVDEERDLFVIEVPSQTDNYTLYEVSLTIKKDAVGASCDCPAFEKNKKCKHIVAATIEVLTQETDLDFEDIETALAEKMGSTTSEEPMPGKGGKVIWFGKTVSLFEDDVILKWQFFRAHPIRAFSEAFKKSGYARSRFNAQKIRLLSEDKTGVKWRFEYKHNKSLSYFPEIQYDRKDVFGFFCTCKYTSIMCEHAMAAFDYLEEKFGSRFFLDFLDLSVEKAKLLEEYGLTPEDKEAENFTFSFDYSGNLNMQVPSFIWGKNADASIKNFRKLLSPAAGELTYNDRPKLAKEAIIDFASGFLFNLLSQHHRIGFELELIKVFEKSGGKQFKKLSIHQSANLGLLKEFSDDIYSLIYSLSDDGIKKYLAQNGHGYITQYANPWQSMSDATTALLKKYYISQLQKLWPFLCNHPQVYMLKEGNFANKNIIPATLSPDLISFSFSITEDERFITILQKPAINNVAISEVNIRLFSGFLFLINDVFYLPANIDDLNILKQFQHGYIKIPVANKLQVLQNIIPVLQQKYTVELPGTLHLTTIQPDPKPHVLLKEFETKYLMLQAQFIYEETEVDFEKNPEDLLQILPDGSYQVIKRNAVREHAFFESLRVLHPTFEKQRQNDFFYIPFDEVMKKNWFLNMVHQLQENDIPLLGLKELKKFRYNTNKPKWEMKAGSGMDWFDLKIEVSFGDQAVSLKDVRKALISKQNMVVLDDGSIGMLPEEWLKQYGLILKIGQEQKDGTLRLSKLHYTLIDELHNQIDDEEVLKEINDKKQRLHNIGNVQMVPVSKAITATLRPYQESGLQWMQTLDELGWGGCLADDMGLGKTLQTITFLQFLKEKYVGSTHLVVCPTSLIYNWEAELKKFSPNLTYHIYYGSAREFSNEHFEDYDIIITTYGLIRNDLEQLLKFQWHYVILDESQAIKNPDALTTKAVQLLKSKNRLILSGTPVQNNTFDLYAQFNFINAGLLGNREFYKEFANGIDKYNDAEKAAQLRKMVYPFMLRRTKEQVAKDLPDKTEMILWCEMYKEQQAVYDDYKNHYRTTLLKKIEEVGMAKAGMYILEGLLRLRQICDSPQLVKNNEVTTQKSIKIDELMREIEENTGSHKLLVFSQFTEMLHLIKERLDIDAIRFSYLDGSTPANKRREAVDQFQNDTTIKVFLISLKAGGVGLNLTAADYIYLIDPWWNPAVEQQAIDRTHRIGQKNKIFAYKMICKNTIEEKILQLQQRKKQIANELVTEDAGFIKKLSREDVEFLFG